MKPTPRPIADWLNELPPSYRKRAVSQCLKGRDLRKCASLWEALLSFSDWSDTNEGFNFWYATAEAAKGNSPLPPLPDDGHGGPSLEPEEHNTMTDYSNTPVARPTLVYGEDVAGMNEARCMQVMRAINAEVEDLKKVAVIADSVLIQQRIAERGAALAEVVVRLDSFATPSA